MLRRYSAPVCARGKNSRAAPRYGWLAPASLSSHNCIEYDYAESNAWRFRSGERTQRIAATGRLRANSGWALRSLALAGQGIALLPRFLVHEDLAAGRLVSVLEDALDADLDVMALLPPGRRIAAKSRAFVDFIAERLRDERWWADARPRARASA